MVQIGIDPGKPSLLHVSSSGGVLLELLALEPELSSFSQSWAVVEAEDTRSALAGRQVHWIEDVSARDPRRLAASFIDAARILSQVRPRLILSAGSGPAFPFFALARLKRIPAFWISTLNIHEREGLTAQLCSTLATRMFVQQMSLMTSARRGTYIGELY